MTVKEMADALLALPEGCGNWPINVVTEDGESWPIDRVVVTEDPGSEAGPNEVWVCTVGGDE